MHHIATSSPSSGDPTVTEFSEAFYPAAMNARDVTDAMDGDPLRPTLRAARSSGRFDPRARPPARQPARDAPSEEPAMLPDPLHPALVHFPIVLGLLAPLVAIALLWAIQTGRLPARAWIAVVLLQALIVGAGWITAEAGEEEEERVERVVREEVIEEHEEAAEWFNWIAAGTAAIAAAGLLPGTLGTVARGLAVVGALVAALAVVRVGHSGGELVYKHGAALAYLEGEAGVEAIGRSVIDQILSGGGGGGSDEADEDSGRKRKHGGN